MSTDCTRDAGHQGPCNGYPRIEGGLHCYTMRPEHPAYGSKVHVPYSGPSRWRGLYTDGPTHNERGLIEELGVAEARITDLEAENARLATRVNELIAMTSTDH